MRCSICGADELLFGTAARCASCDDEAAQRRIASYRNHPSQQPPLKRRRKRREFFVIDGRNPDHIAPGEEF